MKLKGVLFLKARVLQHLLIGGKEYNEGDTIEMSENLYNHCIKYLDENGYVSSEYLKKVKTRKKKTEVKE